MGTGIGRMVSREGRKAGGLEKYNPKLHKFLGTLFFDQLTTAASTRVSPSSCGILALSISGDPEVPLLLWPYVYLLLTSTVPVGVNFCQHGSNSALPLTVENQTSDRDEEV